jgi:hypothetical protein
VDGLVDEVTTRVLVCGLLDPPPVVLYDLMVNLERGEVRVTSHFSTLDLYYEACFVSTVAALCVCGLLDPPPVVLYDLMVNLQRGEVSITVVSLLCFGCWYGPMLLVPLLPLTLPSEGGHVAADVHIASVQERQVDCCCCCCRTPGGDVPR